MNTCRLLLRTILTSSLLLGLCPLAASAQPSRKLDLDRLYTLPWVIGTRPIAPVWSPNSQHVAFLWNDGGTDFLDLWMTDVTSGKAVRVTSMPRPTFPANPGADVAKLEQQARAETDHGVSSAVWSPDGQHLLFTFHGHLFEVQPGRTPHQLASELPAISNLSAAPRGNLLGFLSNGLLYTLDLHTGTSTKRYSAGKQDVAVEEFHWSNDGSRLAFIEADESRVPVRGIPDYLGEETRMVKVKRPFPGEPSASRRLGIVSTSGGNVLWASLGDNPLDLINGVSWSPEGKTLLIDKSDLYIKDRRLLLVSAETGKATTLLEEKDAKNVTDEWWSDWAPDGSGVFFTSDRDNDYHVYFEPLGGGAPKPITAGNWAVFSAELPPSAKDLFVVSNQGKAEERQLFRVALSGGHPERLTAKAGTHTPVTSPDGRFFADVFSDDGTPPDLYLQRTTPGAHFLQVTHSPLPEFNQYHWSIARYVDFPNIHDGVNLHARITFPPNFDKSKKYPAILGSVYSNSVHNQWGGRIFHPTWGLDQYLAQQGYIILNIDISGSSGYGKSFRQRIGQDYGGIDVEDLYSGARYLVAQGFVDEHRIGMWGSSYGGLLTTTSLFTHPGVYRAGIAGAPATSLFHALTGEMKTMMAPQDHAQQYAKSSAFLKSGGLQDHLMIIHGMKDEVVLFQDSITLEERLILQGRDINLVVLPNAPHGWDTEGLAQTRYAYHRMVDYFRTTLGEGPQP